jgi:phosphinothricin acetyltransferase
MSATETAIRGATEDDIPSITSIYAHAVRHTVATLDTVEPSVDAQMEWFRRHDDRHPVIVAVQHGNVVGWASLSEWSPKRGYRDTAEASVYVAHEHQGLGVGGRLLRELVTRARSVGLHVLVARIASTNSVSLGLVARHGFRPVGTMQQAGHKFGNYIDVAIWQLILDRSA